MSARRALSLLRPLFLFSVPLWLVLIPLPGAGYRSVTGTGREWAHFPIFSPSAFQASFSATLVAVVAAQATFTLARLSSFTLALAARRRAFGQAMTVGLTLLWATYLSAGAAWIRLDRATVPSQLPGTVTHVAVTLAVAFLAFETSRRGPFSGLLAVFAGADLALFLLGPWLRWTRTLTAEESASPASTDPTATSG